MAEYDDDKPKKRHVPMYKIALDLRGFPFAEEMMHECEDGKTRAGIFIPYEENNVYRGEKVAIANIAAVGNSVTRRKSTLNNINWTHTLQPYWTHAHQEEMAAVGIERRNVYLGHVEVLQWRGFGGRR